MEYLSEYEDLLKLKDFYDKKENPQGSTLEEKQQYKWNMSNAFDCTYEKISKALKNEYCQSIAQKLDRWVQITNVQYFENAKCIPYYFQAKMLFRDGFYESAIMLTRSICEMICYDILSKIAHPFGNLDLIETPMFRVFVDFIALPKTIEKNIFEKQIVDKITALDDKNFLKSSYFLNTTENKYHFKNENGKKPQRFYNLFEIVGYTKVDNFNKDTHKLFHKIYDIGNLYVHSKPITNKPIEDARNLLLMLMHILWDIYGIKDNLVGKIIKSGYTNFPDICKGDNYLMECAICPKDTDRIYLNLPNDSSKEKLWQCEGKWKGLWKDNNRTEVNGLLTFNPQNKGFLTAQIQYKNHIEDLEIKLFENYFHIKEFDSKSKKHDKSKHIHFELEFFKGNLLLGTNIANGSHVIFQKIV